MSSTEPRELLQSRRDAERAALADLPADDPIVVETRRRLVEAVEVAIACAGLLGVSAGETTAPWQLQADAWQWRCERDRREWTP